MNKCLVNLDYLVNVVQKNEDKDVQLQKPLKEIILLYLSSLQTFTEVKIATPLINKCHNSDSDQIELEENEINIFYQIISQFDTMNKIGIMQMLETNGFDIITFEQQNNERTNTINN